jgi:hypothetical protein
MRRSRKNNGFHGPYRKAGRHFRGGRRAAALRAELAARVNLGLPIPKVTEIEAAAQTGSNPKYTASLVAVLRTGDDLLLAKVRSGGIGILEAGEVAKARLQFIAGFRKMKTVEERKAVAQQIGVAELWDNLILPGLEAAE